MRIIKKNLLPTSWSLLVVMTVSGCTYYAALERETVREVKSKEELQKALDENEHQLRIKKEREAQVAELEQQIEAIEKELDKLERSKQEEERKIKRMHAGRKQEREKELRRIRKEFDPKIKRLTAERNKKKNKVSKLQERNSE
ncbi:MAG: hypothetical protein D3916_02370 [Candidatus Electrothrix sp. MAN1_4]|nr:hypothetical protein [Candidatus Electrothrix sp. MAN1_4]